MSDSNDYNNFENDDFDEEWDEEKWEQFFQQEDEQKRRLEELIEKYGFSEEGLRRAFEEMGYDIPYDSEEEDDIEEQDRPEDEDIDELLEQQYGSWSPEFNARSNLENAHPLFHDCYHFILNMMRIFKHVSITSKEHPLVTFQSGLFECMSKLIRAGYDDIDFNLEAERGLILAALKRARRSLFNSLLTIPKLFELNILNQANLKQFRYEITDLLKQINQEIVHYKNQH